MLLFLIFLYAISLGLQIVSALLLLPFCGINVFPLTLMLTIPHSIGWMVFVIPALHFDWLRKFGLSVEMAKRFGTVRSLHKSFESLWDIFFGIKEILSKPRLTCQRWRWRNERKLEDRRKRNNKLSFCLFFGEHSFQYFTLVVV